MFCPKHIMLQLEKLRDGKLKGKTDLKNDIKNLVNFHKSIRKSEKLYFHRILLSKTYLNYDEE